MMRNNSTPADVEVITGQIVAKANNYQSVPDKATGGRRIIKNSRVRTYERNFLKQCRVYAGRMINRPFELIVTVYYLHNNFGVNVNKRLKC